MKANRSGSSGRTWRACVLALGLVVPALLSAARGAEPGSRTDYASFRLITERNIFNASRSGGRSEAPRATRRPTRVDAFGLVGVMSYERGTFAFFDGSGSDYRRTLQAGEGIAGFALVEIQPNAVRLQPQDTNTTAVEMRLGMQLRREDAGEWKLSERTDSFDSSGPGPRSGSGYDRRRESDAPSAGGSTRASATSSATSSADAEEALQRLLKKRQEENP